MITINIEKAKEIQKEKIRKIRKPLLEKLDVEFQIALETGKDTSDIVSQKQLLRDVTNLVTETEITASTANEIAMQIKAIWDEDLLGPNPLDT